jgi:hypothetical protein
MEQLITFLILGVVLIVLGIPAMHGNVRMLHSYHYKRVKAEDMLSFGRLTAIGNFIIGGGMIVSGILFFLAERNDGATLSFIAPIFLIVSLVVGIGIAFYAMFKYNKGIF